MLCLKTFYDLSIKKGYKIIDVSSDFRTPCTVYFDIVVQLKIRLVAVKSNGSNGNIISIVSKVSPRKSFSRDLCRAISEVT